MRHGPLCDPWGLLGVTCFGPVCTKPLPGEHSIPVECGYRPLSSAAPEYVTLRPARRVLRVTVLAHNRPLSHFKGRDKSSVTVSPSNHRRAHRDTLGESGKRFFEGGRAERRVHLRGTGRYEKAPGFRRGLPMIVPVVDQRPRLSLQPRNSRSFFALSASAASLATAAASSVRTRSQLFWRAAMIAIT